MRMRFAKTHSPRQEDTPKVKAKTLAAKVEVSPDGEGLVSHAGAFLLTELADRLGLTEALKAMAPARKRRSAHDPGVVLRDLAVAIADGGDCITDFGVLAGQQDLFGRVASCSTAHRVIGQLDAERLEAIRSARAKSRKAAWAAGAGPSELTIDIDATLLVSHSEKAGAAGNYKGGFGFHPLLAYLDESGEALAGVLRPGNAGSNTAEDHFTGLSEALEQIPGGADLKTKVLARTDGGGATHAFTADCREAKIASRSAMSSGRPCARRCLELPESAWRPAIEAGGEIREGAWVAELTALIDLCAWPERVRLIVCRERAHPGAQMSFSDHEGHRFTAFLTDTDGGIAALELRHRRRARVEDSIRRGKDTGMRNLPFADFGANEAWLELSLIAQDLLAWAGALILDGALAQAEPKRLRQRLFHVAGRVARSGRRTILRLPRSWPWAEALVAAFERLRALPAPSPP